MFVLHKRTVLIDLFRHPPCMDSQNRNSITIQSQADNLGIVKARPAAKSRS
jgi:hypothetical protein